MNQYIFKKPKNGNILILPDLHGAYSKTINILRFSNLINNNNEWIGGNTYIVCLGDIFDSCRKNCLTSKEQYNDDKSDIELLIILLKLSEEAKKCGGRIFFLYGNHEILNFIKDYRYVSMKDLLYPDENLIKHLKNKDFLEAINLIKKLSNKINVNNLDSGIKFRSRLFEKISNLIAENFKVAIIIDKNIFTHAGLLPDLKKYSKNNKIDNNFLNDLNKSVYKWLIGQSNGKSLLFNDTQSLMYTIIYNEISPLWTREYGFLDKNLNENDIKCSKLLSVLNDLGLDNMFIGHTPSVIKDMNIYATCSNRLFLADTSLSESFENINNDRFFIIHKNYKYIYQLNKNNITLIDKIN